jgi:hypothetical protein
VRMQDVVGKYCAPVVGARDTRGEGFADNYIGCDAKYLARISAWPSRCSKGSSESSVT